VDSSVKSINDSISKSLKERKPWHEQIREGFYYKDGFERYKGTIRVAEYGSFLYDSIIIKVLTTKKEHNIIFEKGIFHPGVFFGKQSGEALQIETRPDSSNALGTCYTDYNVIKLSVLEEITEKKLTLKIKRFRIWRWNCWSMNPSEYIFDLENKLAKEETTLEEFILGSKLTFIRFVTIII
jgi:hypothetical protein